MGTAVSVPIGMYLLVDEGLPEQDEPLGGQKAKPGHQGEHHGQPEPVPSEYRQGLEPVLNISSPRHPHLQFSHSELSR